MHRASDVKTGGAVLEFTFSFIQKEKKNIFIESFTREVCKTNKKMFFFSFVFYSIEATKASRENCVYEKILKAY